MFKKIITFLRKIGVLQMGGKSATWTKGSEMPDEFLTDEIPDKVREEAKEKK